MRPYSQNLYGGGGGGNFLVCKFKRKYLVKIIIFVRPMCWDSVPTETLVVVAMETSPAEFLELIPDDGTASYFLPHLLTCSQRHLMA